VINTQTNTKQFVRRNSGRVIYTDTFNNNNNNEFNNSASLKNYTN